MLTRQEESESRSVDQMGTEIGLAIIMSTSCMIDLQRNCEHSNFDEVCPKMKSKQLRVG
jgi:predicted metal-binding protein